MPIIGLFGMAKQSFIITKQSTTITMKIKMLEQKLNHLKLSNPQLITIKGGDDKRGKFKKDKKKDLGIAILHDEPWGF